MAKYLVECWFEDGNAESGPSCYNCHCLEEANSEEEIKARCCDYWNDRYFAGTDVRLATEEEIEDFRRIDEMELPFY